MTFNGAQTFNSFMVGMGYGQQMRDRREAREARELEAQRQQ